MSIDPTAMDYADDTFIRSMRALNSMELADLPPEFDQDVRDIARIIQEHGPDYADTEHGDMTAPLLESLARLVSAAASAQRLQAEVEQLAASEKTCRRIANEKTLEAMELRQQLAAAQAEARNWKREARNWKRIAEDATHVEREELSRVREIVSGMREYADSCDHPSEASKRNAVEYWLTQLEDALSQAAEQPTKRDHAELVRLFNSNDWPRPGAERESLPLALEASRSGAVSERIEDSGRQHRRAAMRKRNGWCIWSPWSGCLSSTFAVTRTECIKVFERDIGSPWRRYREQGFECRPVLFVDARKESGDA